MDKDIVVINKSTTVINTSGKTKKTTSRIEKAIRESVAICFWIYAIIKLFMIDLDIIVMTKIAPQYLWLLDYKFFFLIGLVAFVLLIGRDIKVIVWILYIFFYPFIFFFWKIPKFVLKQKSWVFAVAVINAIVYFIKSIKYFIISGIFFLISFVVVLNSSSKILIWPAIIVTFVLLIITLMHELISVFKPSDIFQMYTKCFIRIREMSVKNNSLDGDIKILQIDALSEEQSKNRIKKLQNLVMWNRIFLFATKRLNDYQNSGINIVSYLLTILILIIYSVISFSIINYGLFKIDASLYSITIKPSLFTFFYYSFNKILSSSISEIKAVMPLSQIASMAELFVAFFIIIILISALITYKNKKATDAIIKVMGELEKEGERIEDFIQGEYKIRDINAAITELERAKSNVIAGIYWLSKN
ncbi:MAG: hypothetical protein ABSC11_11325 [Smithella sp.]|jgi:hypothetical protein